MKVPDGEWERGTAFGGDVRRVCRRMMPRRRLRIHLPASVPPGATVWLCGRWKNYREQPGPASTPVQTFVAGAIAPG